MKIETKHQPVAPFKKFIKRLFRNIAIAFIALIVFLSIGMLGYHYYEQMSWADAYVNAAMILSGMGPVSSLHTESGKIFAGTYALFSGIVFLMLIAIILAPVVHRFLHKFHMDEDKDK